MPFRLAVLEVDFARHDEQEIAEAVQIGDQDGVDEFLGIELDEFALGLAAARAAQVQERSGFASAGEDERSERRDFVGKVVDEGFDDVNVFFGDHFEFFGSARQFGHHFMQIILDFVQHFLVFVLGGERQRGSDPGVEFVDLSVGLDAGAGFFEAFAAGQARRAVVAGLGVQFHDKKRPSKGFLMGFLLL